MQFINLEIKRYGDELMLCSDIKSLGSQHDDNDRKIVFRRPKENEGDDLTLYFSSQYGRLGSFNIGRDNDFPITKVLTDDPKLRLQVSLANDVTTVYSNIIDFHLRPTLQNLEDLPENSSDTQDGDSSIAWRPVLSETGDLSWTRSNMITPPEPVNIMGPQGERGEQGEQGEQGSTGPTGAPGANATINGFETLDIIDSDTVTVELDAESKTVKFTSLLTGEAQPRIEFKSDDE